MDTAAPEKVLRADGWTACVAAFDAQFNPYGVQKHCPHFSLRKCNNVACAKPHVKPAAEALGAFVAAWPVIQQQKKKKLKPATTALSGVKPAISKLPAAISKLPESLQARALRQRAALGA
eukprot:2787532-Prymnesium_polylepis.1